MKLGPLFEGMSLELYPKGSLLQAYGVNAYAYPGLAGHDGIDVYAPYGTPLLAACDATVDWIDDPGTHPGGKTIGLLTDVIENRKYGLTYAHLKDIVVKVGQRVKQGEVIGHIGNSGQDGPGVELPVSNWGNQNPDGRKTHCHFAVRPYIKWDPTDTQTEFPTNGYNGFIDPLPFFSQIPFIPKPPVASPSGSRRMLPAKGPLGPLRFKTPYPASFGSLKGSPHLGIDILCVIGTPVVAPEDGKTLALLNGPEGGLTVHLLGASGVLHRLLHNSQFKCQVGQQVKCGDLVAISGNTGTSTQAHCHWDISKNGVLQIKNINNFMDPLVWIKEGEDMDYRPQANDVLSKFSGKDNNSPDTEALANAWIIGDGAKSREIINRYRTQYPLGSGVDVLIKDIQNVIDKYK